MPTPAVPPLSGKFVPLLGNSEPRKPIPFRFPVPMTPPVLFYGTPPNEKRAGHATSEDASVYSNFNEPGMPQANPVIVVHFWYDDEPNDDQMYATVEETYEPNGPTTQTTYRVRSP